MSTVYAPAIHDLFRGSISALAPIATDIDRARLIRHVRGAGGYRESKVVPYLHRAFDTRWMYGDNGTQECLAVSADLPLVAHHAVAEVDGPINVYALTPANLTADALDFARHNGIPEDDLLHHAVAMTAARRDMRVPLPDEPKTIRESALLGYRFAALFAEHGPLLPMSPQEQALRAFGMPTRIGKEARMLRGSVLRVDGREEVVTRTYRGDELAAIAELGGDEALAILGDRTCDVYLNEKALWRNVPSEVWRFQHRGVQLLRAWLHDRQAETLGRGLLRDEVTHVSTAVRRIVQLLLMQPELAKNAER